jgi:hypothetical protein
MHGADMKKAQNILDLPEDGQEVWTKSVAVMQ